MVEDIMKQMEQQSAAFKQVIDSQAEELKTSKDKIFELELRLKNYEDGYSPPGSVKITQNMKREFSQSDQSNGWQGGWNNSNRNNKKQ